MDKLLDRLSLGVILRHFISGAVFVLAILFADTKSPEKVLLITRDWSAPLGVVALISGTLIYGLHRGLTNPLIECLRHYLYSKGWTLYPDLSLKFLIRRWTHRQEAEESWFNKSKVISDHILAWADYAHLLYTCGLAAWLGSFSIILKYGFKDIQFDCRTFCFGFVFIIAGLVNDIRKQAVEEKYYKS